MFTSDIVYSLNYCYFMFYVINYELIIYLTNSVKYDPPNPTNGIIDMNHKFLSVFKTLFLTSIILFVFFYIKLLSFYNPDGVLRSIWKHEQSGVSHYLFIIMNS